MEHQDWIVTRRDDGVIIVRVPSRCEGLPDAVFSFRAGDPQFEYWHGLCESRRSATSVAV